ncbi:MAG: CDP-glycerol glycerophosphotransferase family protein [Oscillospiraceae bacterium]|nr:CDP-glycerol glycerophosphotransferase family protein [Oscillospiraceae bacterium]
MRIAVILLRWILNFIYFFMKLLPTNKNKVLFLSRQSNTPTEDFMFLEARLRELKPELKTVMITKRADKSFSDLFVFALQTLGSMFHLATASVCVLDSYWPAVSILKHKDSLAVIQIWHAMGKIKKSGYQSLDKGLGRSSMIAHEMRMHRNYDVIIAGGKAFNPFYCASFGVDESVLYNVGLPRMDMLRENTEKCRRQFYDAYPELEGEKIVLYAPTFRKGQILDPKGIVDAFDFNGRQQLIIKRHPNQRLNEENLGQAMTCDEVPTSTVLSVCDCVITDYSAITIEAAILKKPVYFYLFDYEDYLSRNGLNVLLSDEFPDSVFYEPRKLFDSIENGTYDFDNYKRFCEKYLPDQSGRATDKIAALIIDCMEKDKHEAISERISKQN